MFKTLSKKIIYENKWIRLREDEIELPNGEKRFYSYTDRVDSGPMIIPLTDEGKLVLVKEWRYPIRDWTYCFPCGGVEENEDSLTAAKKELRQETGYSAGEWTALGFLKVDPGSNSQTTPVYLARKLKKGEAERESSEIMEIVELSLAEIKRMIKNDELNNSWFLSGYTKLVYFLEKSMKKLYRSKKNKMLAGICGGVGEFTGIDPTLVRLVFLFFLILTGVLPLGLLYFVALFIIPENPGI
ncbi:MAG: PspC domain-containing protein [Patescibacteria group bacterium]